MVKPLLHWLIVKQFFLFKFSLQKLNPTLVQMFALKGNRIVGETKELIEPCNVGVLFLRLGLCIIIRIFGFGISAISLAIFCIIIEA